jgi:cytochrome P450
MPSFNTAHLKGFFPTLQKITARLMKRWELQCAEGKDCAAQKDLMRFTVDVTTNLAFGYDLSTLDGTGAGEGIQTHLEKIFPALQRRINVPFPYWRYFRLPKDRVLDRAIRKVYGLINEILAGTRREIERNPELKTKPANFLHALLSSQEQEGSALSNDELVAHVLTILVAGEDTTANAISWMMYFSLLYPEVQEKMYAEALQVLGNRDWFETYQDTERLTYIEAVANESMRLKPVAPFLMLEAIDDIQVSGVQIPKGTKVVPMTSFAAVQEENFTHAAEFRPERWLEEFRPDFPIHNVKASLPFGGGPRFCPGRNLALLEMKTTMAMACRKFRFSPPRNGQKMREELAFVVIPANFWVSLHRRSPPSLP